MEPAQNIAAFLLAGALTASFIPTFTAEAPRHVPLSAPSIVHEVPPLAASASSPRERPTTGYRAIREYKAQDRVESQVKRTEEGVDLAWKVFETIFVIVFGFTALVGIIRALPE